jgi:hypothetical protein
MRRHRASETIHGKPCIGVALVLGVKKIAPERLVP